MTRLSKVLLLFELQARLAELVRIRVNSGGAVLCFAPSARTSNNRHSP